MCGIVGYVGHQQALPLVLAGLRRLEYRGYDSSGIAVLDGAGGLVVEKRAGRIENLDKALATDHPGGIAGTTGLGHTRWATHGAPTDRNAHPHLDTDDAVAVIHNGIIENFAPLRAELEAAGVELRSETDTEVVAHLLAAALPAVDDDLAEAMRAVCRRLQGAFTLVVAHRDQPGRVVAARRNSPLVVGVGAGETFLASDVAAFVEHTRQAVELGQDQVVEITAAGYTVTDLEGSPVEVNPFTVTWDLAAAEKGGHPYFMLKEIEEQPAAVADTLLGHFAGGRIVLDEQRLDAQELRDVDKVFVVACGTAYHSGLIAKYAIEHWTRVPVEVEMASEFRYRDPVLDRDTLVVAISQSGETADTLEAVRHAREQKARVLAICNTNGAQIPRESDAVLYTRAGPEIGVAATKTFLAQIVATHLVGLALAQAKGTKYGDEVEREHAALEAMPDRIAQVLGVVEPVRAAGPGHRRLQGGALPRPARRLPGGAGGRAQAQGAGVHARRGLRGRGAQARADRADRGRAAGGRGDAVAVGPAGAAREAAVQHPGGPRPRRPHHRDRRGRRRDGPAVRAPPDPGAAHAHPAQPAGHHGAAAGAGGRDRPGPRLRRGQAPQPGQVRHRRVAAARRRRWTALPTMATPCAVNSDSMRAGVEQTLTTRTRWPAPASRARLASGADPSPRIRSSSTTSTGPAAGARRTNSSTVVTAAASRIPGAAASHCRRPSSSMRSLSIAATAITPAMTGPPWCPRRER